MLTHVQRGFVVVHETPGRVLLQKRKVFEWGWGALAFLGIIGTALCLAFVVCFVPLVVYLVYYATQPDVVVVEVVLGPLPGS